MTDAADAMVTALDEGLRDAAEFLAGRMREVTGVQAELDPSSPTPRARYRATPGAPPRMVSQLLNSSIDSGQVQRGLSVVGVRRGPDYAADLEAWMGHPFFESTLVDGLGEAGNRIEAAMRR